MPIANSNLMAIIGANGLRSSLYLENYEGYAEQILRDGKADFVAMGRALIADPYWPPIHGEARVPLPALRELDQVNYLRACWPWPGRPSGSVGGPLGLAACRLMWCQTRATPGAER